MVNLRGVRIANVEAEVQQESGNETVATGK